MNEHIKALSIYLAALTPSPSGWMTIDRDRAATALGVGRVKLARILAKAEKSIGIEVEGDRVRFIEKANFSRKPKKVDLGRILAAASDLIREYERNSSRN